MEAKPLESIQQRFMQYYQTGQVVKFNQAYEKHKIKAGDYFKVNKITPKHLRDNMLPLVLPNGKTHLFPLKNLPHHKHYRSQT